MGRERGRRMSYGRETVLCGSFDRAGFARSGCDGAIGSEVERGCFLFRIKEVRVLWWHGKGLVVVVHIVGIMRRSRWGRVVGNLSTRGMHRADPCGSRHGHQGADGSIRQRHGYGESTS